MTIQEVKDILKGNFSDPADRAYWEEKLQELEIKAERAKENARNMKKLRKEITWAF